MPIKFEEFCQFPFQFCELLGFDSVFNVKMKPNSWRIKLFLTFALILFIISTMLMIVTIFIYGDNKGLVITAGMNIAITIATIIRLFITLLNRNKFDAIISNLRENFPSNGNMDQQRTVYELQMILKKYLKIYGYVYITFAALFLMQLIGYFAANGPVKFDAAIWVPFDYQTTLKYILAGSLTVVFNFTSLITKYFTDFLLFEVTTLISVELRVCALMVKETLNDSDLSSKKLKCFIDYQTKVNDTAHNLEKFYSGLMVLCYFDNLAVISFMGFLIATANNISDIITQSMQMFMLMVQLFYPFYFSQMVIDSSESIETAIIESNWNEIKDKKIRKMLILILLASQRKRCLRAKGYKVVSYQDYTHIITTAHSYIAVMRHLYYN